MPGSRSIPFHGLPADPLDGQRTVGRHDQITRREVFNGHFALVRQKWDRFGRRMYTAQLVVDVTYTLSFNYLAWMMKVYARVPA